jgi:hypothetical protein
MEGKDWGHMVDLKEGDICWFAEQTKVREPRMEADCFFSKGKYC